MPGRIKKPPELVSQIRREAAQKRHHPELVGGDRLNRPDDDGRDLPGRCAYDGIVFRPATYQDAVQREKAIAEEIENEKRRDEALVRRGKLFNAEQIKARDDKWNAAAQLEAEKVQRLVDGIEGVTPAIRAAFLDRYREWRKTLGDHLSKVHG